MLYLKRSKSSITVKSLATVKTSSSENHSVTVVDCMVYGTDRSFIAKNSWGVSHPFIEIKEYAPILF
jgi:hypothetical protein